MQDLINQSIEGRSEISISQNGNENKESNKNFKKRKIFKKDNLCPYHNCLKRYSSRIALNCHLRKRHQVPSKYIRISNVRP